MYRHATTYNTYYEFGTGKAIPRCVEAWSMMIPWIGFEFNRLAELVEPTSKARLVEFVTAAQPACTPAST